MKKTLLNVIDLMGLGTMCVVTGVFFYSSIRLASRIKKNFDNVNKD